MKAYIINLDCDTLRREDMLDKIAATPVADAEIFDAVDGRTMSPDEAARRFDFERFARMHRSPRPNPGEVGCSLSHYSLWQRIAAGREPAIILEDDIHFTGPWKQPLEYCADWLASDEPRVVLMVRQFFYRRAKEVLPGVRAARPISACGTECYIINPAGARLLVNLGRPHYVADEWDYYASQGLQISALLDHPVSVDYDYATNIPTRSAWNHDWNIFTKIAAAFPFYSKYFLSKTGLLHLYDRDWHWKKK